MLANAPRAKAGRPTAYLIPGLLCDRHIWRHQAAALAGRWEVRVPELFDCRSIGAMATRILAEAPDHFVLAGHSMGGRVALDIVRRAPARVKGLALLDTGVHPRAEGEEKARMALLQLAERQGMSALAERWLPPMVNLDRLSDDTLMKGLRAMVERMSPAIFRNQIMALLGRPDARNQLAAIRCPTLIGVGRDDAWSPLAQHERISAAVAGSHLVVFERSGHMAPVEAPRAVTEALLDWIGRVEGSA